MRCGNVIHPHTCLDSASAYFYLDSRCTRLFHARLGNQRKKKTLITSQTSIIKEYNTMWRLLTDTIPPGRTIMHEVISSVAVSTMAVGHCTKTSDPGVNGILLTEDYAAKVKEDYARCDTNVAFSHDASLTTM